MTDPGGSSLRRRHKMAAPRREEVETHGQTQFGLQSRVCGGSGLTGLSFSSDTLPERVADTPRPRRLHFAKSHTASFVRSAPLGMRSLIPAQTLPRSF